MNPLVEKMLNTTVSNDVETRFLEDLFEQDCKCESRHTNPENPYCSGAAVYYCTSVCDSEGNRLCYAAGRYVERCMKNSDAACSDCGRPCSECWTIRPI